MQPLSVVALFCEDIRQEHNEVNTLVGIMPDNMIITGMPAMLPKLCIYARIIFDAYDEIAEMFLELSVPGTDNQIPISEIKPELIQEAKREALAKGSPIAGIIARAIFSPFHIPSEGRLCVLATAKGETITCGTLNIQMPMPSSETTASQPPS